MKKDSKGRNVSRKKERKYRQVRKEEEGKV
jgi:hypothetical protein